MHSLTRVLVPFWASSVLSTWTHRSVRSLRGAVRLVIHPCPNTCTQHPLLLMPDAVLLLSTSGFSSHQRATQTYVWRSDGVRTEPDDDHSSDVEKNNTFQNLTSLVLHFQAFNLNLGSTICSTILLYKCQKYPTFLARLSVSGPCGWMWVDFSGACVCV